MTTDILPVHEDQLLEAGQSIFGRDFIHKTFPLRKLGEDTGLKLDGVALRIGDLVMTEWGQIRWKGSRPAMQLAMIVSVNKKGFMVLKFRGTGGWTQHPVPVLAQRVLARPPESRILHALKTWAQSWREEVNRKVRGIPSWSLYDADRPVLTASIVQLAQLEKLITTYEENQRANRKIIAKTAGKRAAQPVPPNFWDVLEAS